MTRVLLVHDRAEGLEHLGVLLKKRGFLTDEARDSAEALIRARESPPDVVISDLLTPRKDIHRLLRTWKEDPALLAIPFIVYTAAIPESDDERRTGGLGADALILNPLAPDVLIRHVEQLLSTRVPQALKPLDAEPHFNTGLLKQYNDLLVRKLVRKTLQVETSKRELLHEVLERDAAAQAQVAILNALPARVALLDLDGSILAVNDSWRGFANAHGLALADFGVGCNYLAVCRQAENSCPAEAIGVADGIQSVLDGRSGVFVLEYRCATATEDLWFRMMVSPLQGRRVSGAMVMHIDVTDRKGTETQLRDSQQQHLDLLNATAEGIYGLDLAGVCTFCNPAAARLLGFEHPQEVIGRNAHRQHHGVGQDSDPGLATCHVHGAFRDGTSTHGDAEWFTRRDGRRFPVEFWTHPIFSGGDIVGAVVTFLDISERRSLEAQLLQSQKMEAIGRLAGGVAHDFNNALQVVTTCSELLDQQLEGLPLLRTYVREIQAASARAAALTRQLLAFSRTQELRPVRVDLNAVVEDIKAMLGRIIGEDIDLQISISRDACIVDADTSQIGQVLLNLAVNARDAMPQGGALSISTSKVDTLRAHISERLRSDTGFVVLSVHDTGFGMDAGTQSRIFEPFYTTKEPGKGSGLGLSTVYGIVRQSGGWIDVDSRPNGGTQFDIYLPSSTGTPEVALPAPLARRTRNANEVILLVEDEASLLTLVSVTLLAEGYTVLEARNARLALLADKESHQRIDLLVTDVILPDLSGPQLATQMTAADPTLGVLYISGYTDDCLKVRAQIADRTLLLEKPFSIHSLLTKIREALQARPAAIP